MSAKRKQPSFVRSGIKGRVQRFASLLRRPGGQLVAASFWSLVLRGAGMLSTFVLGIQLARYLGPAQYGIYGLTLAVAMLLSAFAQLGLPTLATREVALARSGRDFPELRGIIRWFALATLTVSIVLAAVFVVGANLWPGTAADQFKTPATIGAALVPLFALTVLVSAELRALNRLVLGQSLEILVRPLTQSLLCLGVFLALGSLGVNMALALSVAASLLALLLAAYWLRRELPSEARAAEPRHHLRKWLRAAAPLALTDVLRQLDGVYAVLLVGLLTSTYETGIFRVAQSSMMLIAMPLFVVQVVVAPTLARLFEGGESAKLQSLLRLAALASFAAGAVGTLLVAVAGKRFISLAFGADYAGAWLPLLILCVYQTVTGLFGVGLVLLPMVGAGRELTISYAAAMFASVISGVVFILKWGAIGAAFAAIVGAVVNGLLASYFARSRTGLDVTLLSLVRANRSP